MSEAELHVLAGRLQESKRAAAARGVLRFPLPVGYVFDEDGQTVLDSDEGVRAAVSDLFAAFETAGSAYGVVRAFRDRPFPCRAYGGAWAGQIRWGRLTHGRVLGVLSNPAYAGTYVFGRSYARRVVDTHENDHDTHHGQAAIGMACGDSKSSSRVHPLGEVPDERETACRQ
jgi:hypothetical protein